MTVEETIAKVRNLDARFDYWSFPTGELVTLCDAYEALRARNVELSGLLTSSNAACDNFSSQIIELRAKVDELLDNAASILARAEKAEAKVEGLEKDAEKQSRRFDAMRNRFVKAQKDAYRIAGMDYELATAHAENDANEFIDEFDAHTAAMQKEQAGEPCNKCGNFPGFCLCNLGQAKVQP